MSYSITVTAGQNIHINIHLYIHIYIHIYMYININCQDNGMTIFKTI
jgi:hypothetical protein